MSEFRNGQWVLFPCDLPEAHKARDGRVVGIFRKASKDPLTRKPVPAHVVPVRPDGRNIRRLDDAYEAVLIAFDPATLAMEALVDKADLPPGREVSPDWKP